MVPINISIHNVLYIVIKKEKRKKKKRKEENNNNDNNNNYYASNAYIGCTDASETDALCVDIVFIVYLFC